MEEYEKNIERIEKEYSMLDICSIRERLAKVESRMDAADKALELARDSLSRNGLISVITVVMSIVSVILVWFKH